MLIKCNPTFGFDVSSCTLNDLRFALDKNCHMERDDYDEKFGEWSRFVEGLHEQLGQLVVVDPAMVLCDEHLCYSEFDGIPLYKDSGHLNYEGSQLIGRLYTEQFGNPFTSAVKELSN